MNLSQSVLALQYVRVQITATKSGVHYDPTGDTVVMAFVVADTDPISGDWKAAIWETIGAGTSAIYNAMCLVGPGGTIALAKGVWAIWVKVTDSPEIPAENVGTLTIY